MSFAFIDFHTHHVPAEFDLSTTLGLPDDQKSRWESINARLRDPADLLSAIEDGDVTARVVNTPTALITPPQTRTPRDLFARINDRLARISADARGRLPALASVDAFDGEYGAREAERALDQLGFRGLFIESAQGDVLLDAPQVRATLRVAAQRHVPIFVHPVNPQPLSRQMAPYGRLGTLFARGSINEAALISLIAGGVFDELPDLKIVVTNLAIGGLLLAGGFAASQERDVATILRRNIYIDTMGFHPTLLRAALDLVGPEHVLAGSDWPIVSTGAIQEPLTKAFDALDLPEDTRRKIASDNVRQLLRL